MTVSSPAASCAPKAPVPCRPPRRSCASWIASVASKPERLKEVSHWFIQTFLHIQYVLFGFLRLFWAYPIGFFVCLTVLGMSSCHICLFLAALEVGFIVKYVDFALIFACVIRLWLARHLLVVDEEIYGGSQAVALTDLVHAAKYVRSENRIPWWPSTKHGTCMLLQSFWHYKKKTFKKKNKNI